jgi:hypothetical protein
VRALKFSRRSFKMCWCDRYKRTPNCGSEDCIRFQEVVDSFRAKIKYQKDTIEGLTARCDANRKLIENQAKLLDQTKMCGVCKHFMFIGAVAKLPHCNLRNIKITIRDTCPEFNIWMGE